MILNQVIIDDGLDIVGSVEASATANSTIQKGEFIQVSDVFKHSESNPFPQTTSYYTTSGIRFVYLNNGYYFLAGQGYNSSSSSSSSYNRATYYTFLEQNGAFTYLTRTYTSLTATPSQVDCLYANDEYALCLVHFVSSSFTKLVLYKIVYGNEPELIETIDNIGLYQDATDVILLDNSHFALYGVKQYDGSTTTNQPVFMIYSFSDTTFTYLNSYPLTAASNSPTTGKAIRMNNGKIIAIYAQNTNVLYAVVNVNNDYSLTYETSNISLPYSGFTPSSWEINKSILIKDTDILICPYLVSSKTGIAKLEYSSATSTLSFINYNYFNFRLYDMASCNSNTFMIVNSTNAILLDRDLNIIIQYAHNLPYVLNQKNSIAYSNNTYYVTAKAEDYLGYYYSSLYLSQQAAPATNKIDGVAISSAIAGQSVTFLTDANYTPGSGDLFKFLYSDDSDYLLCNSQYASDTDLSLNTRNKIPPFYNSNYAQLPQLTTSTNYQFAYVNGYYYAIPKEINSSGSSTNKYWYYLLEGSSDWISVSPTFTSTGNKIDSLGFYVYDNKFYILGEETSTGIYLHCFNGDTLTRIKRVNTAISNTHGRVLIISPTRVLFSYMNNSKAYFITIDNGETITNTCYINNTGLNTRQGCFIKDNNVYISGRNSSNLTVASFSLDTITSSSSTSTTTSSISITGSSLGGCFIGYNKNSGNLILTAVTSSQAITIKEYDFSGTSITSSSISGGSYTTFTDAWSCDYGCNGYAFYTSTNTSTSAYYIIDSTHYTTIDSILIHSLAFINGFVYYCNTSSNAIPIGLNEEKILPPLTNLGNSFLYIKK